MKRIVLIIVLVEAGLVVLGFVGGWLTGTPILAGARIDLQSTASAVAATIPLLALVWISLRPELKQFAGLRDTFRKNVMPLLGHLSVPKLIVVAIMAGIGEEVFFRGFLQGWLGSVINPWLAIVAINVGFGLAHAVSLGYVIAAFFLGACMGTLLLVTGNLYVPIAVHALYDFFALTMIVRTMRPAGSEPVPTEA